MSVIIDTITTILLENIERVLNNNRNDFSDYNVYYGVKVELDIYDLYIHKIQDEILQNSLFIDFQNKKRNSGVQIDLCKVVQITNRSYFCEVKISKVKNINF